LSEFDFSEKSITRAKKEADKRIHGFTDDQIRHLRIKAKKDPFFLGYGILGYKKFSPNLHGNLCQWLLATITLLYRLILLPRSHYKSTLVTITDTISIVLPDDLGDSPHPRNLGTNGRVLITHEIHDAATRFLYSITTHFLSNPLLIGLFPETTPSPKLQRINKNELELPRDSIWSEPTIDTMGVGGRNQGRHYNYIKADDIYGAAARDSKTERESTILWFDNIQSYFVTPLRDHLDICGTRWAFDDIYAHAMKVYGDKLKTYVRACEEVNKDGQKVPIFPEEFSPESLQILKQNRTVWNAQYVNNPREGSAEFDPAWLRYYNFISRSRDIGVFDKVFGAERIPYECLDRVILIDPATHGLTGFVVTGTDSKDRNFVLEATKKNWRPNEFVDYLFAAVVKWQPRVVAIESVLFSELYQHWIVREMSMRHIRFKLIPVKTRQKAKNIRISALSNFFNAGQIFFNERDKELIEEYYEFGASENVHLLDALAYGPEVWKTGYDAGMISKLKKAEDEILKNLDPMTGYSTI